MRERFIAASAIVLAVFIVVTAINTRSMLASAQIQLICPVGTTFNDGSGLCVDGSACPQDSTFQNGQCVKTTPPTCPPDTTGPDSQGQCTKTTTTNACSSDTTFESGNCKSTTTTPAICPPGSTGPDSQGKCTETTTTPPICSSGYTGPDSNGQCTKTTSTSPTCPSGYGLSNGQCTAPGICPPGTLPLVPFQFRCGTGPTGSNNGQPTCPPGTSLDMSTGHPVCLGSEPQCPSGTFNTAIGACVAQPTCTTGTLQGEECVSTDTTSACPLGTNFENGQCTKTTTTQATCPPDTTGPDSNGQCTKTTTTQATCPSDTTGPDAQGQCTKTTTTPATCPEGSTLTNGNCVTITQISCPTDTTPDSSGTCVADPTCATASGTSAGAVKVAAAGTGGPGVIDPKKYCVTCPKTGKQICDGKQMFKDLVDSLAQKPASQRLSYFQQQLAEIERLDPSFTHNGPYTAPDGSKIYVMGEGGDRALVFGTNFEVAGGVYKGNLGNPNQFVTSSSGIQPEYTNLQVVASPAP